MITGHQKQKKVLQRLKENTPHALLFQGPEKIGKKSLAVDFIKTINSLNQCEQIDKGVHPDLLTITPEKGEIYIEQIEEVIKKVSLKSSFLRTKGVIIDDAHLMNHYAQNSLLKTLEEPSGDTVILLITEYPFMLLPTIVSRTFKLSFGFVEEEDIYKLLQKKGCKESKEIASLSMGKPGLALDYFLDKGKREVEKRRREEFDDIIKGDLSFRFFKAKEVSKKEDLRETMKCWLECLRHEFLKHVEKGKDINKLKGVIEDLEDAIILNRKTNINIQLALEKIMIKL